MSLGRRAGIAVALLVGLALAGAVGYTLAARMVQTRLLAAFGPDAQVDRVALRLGRVEIDGLRVRAPPGSSIPERLAVRRIVAVPALRSLFVGRPVLARVIVDGGHLTLQRTADGRVQLMPDGASSAPGAPASGTSPAPTGGSEPPGRPRESLVIERLDLRDARLVLIDASARRGPVTTRLEAVQATLSNLQLPSVDARTTIRLEATVKAAPGRPAAADGNLLLEGWMVPDTREARLAIRLRGLDLVTVQPYLLRASETGVRAGTLDLDLDAAVADARLHAPGRLTLAGLELGAGGTGTFLGLPRAALPALLADRQGRIPLDFVLQGSLDDPRFSLSEELSMRLAASLADRLGLRLDGLVRGAGGAGRQALDAAAGAIRGLLGR
jgi:hypothetical protein